MLYLTSEERDNTAKHSKKVSKLLRKEQVLNNMRKGIVSTGPHSKKYWKESEELSTDLSWAHIANSKDQEA